MMKTSSGTDIDPSFTFVDNVKVYIFEINYVSK